MNNKVKKQEQSVGQIKRAAVVIAAVLICACFLFMSKAAAKGAADGLELCISRVIPSLFPLIFVSSLMVEVGAAASIAKLTAPVCPKLFRLPGESAAALLLCFLGGYPAGAKAVSQMYSKGQISHECGQRMAMLCFCSGPAFVLGALGSLISGGASLLLLLVQMLTVLILAVAVGRLSKQCDCSINYRTAKHFDGDISGAVVTAAGQSAAAILSVCEFVMLFSSIRAMLSQGGISQSLADMLRSIGLPESLAESVLPMVLEVTSGSMIALQSGLPSCAFALGFGGLSVHMQVLSICKELKLKAFRFLLLRLVQGGIAAALTYIALLLMPEYAVVCSVTASSQAYKMTATCPAGAVTMIVMCIMLTLCINSDNTRQRCA